MNEQIRELILSLQRFTGTVRTLDVVEADLQAAVAHHQGLADQVRQCKSFLMGLEAVVERVGLTRVEQIGDEYEAKLDGTDDLALFGWSHPGWRDLGTLRADALLRHVRLGTAGETNPLPRERPRDFPFVVPLLEASGALVLAHDTRSAETARAVLRSLILRVALAMPGEIRFTLLDPVGVKQAFSPFEGFLSREEARTVRSSAGRTSMEELGEVVDDIRRINERVIRTAPRFSALGPDQRAGEAFEVIVAAGFPKGYTKDPRIIENLVRIANAGPRAGRHLVLEWNEEEKLPYDFTADQLENVTRVDLRRPVFSVDYPPSPEEQDALVTAAYGRSRRREAGDWDSIVRPSAWFLEDASARVSTPLGVRLSFWLGESEDGKQSAHAMLAGQTGSGKSYLLHVLISGLAARYSPQELRFTLIDGKRGVEFEVYRGLPHADVVCLRTGPALARSVVADCLAEMDERYEKFQDAGVVRLSDYRRRTGAPMPRRVVVIDEYQQVLEGDPDVGASMLSRLLEKGRAAGVHLVLGAQTFEQPGLPQSAMTNIHSWAAMALQESYAQSLSMFGQEGRRLIRDLAPSGEAVINDDSGRDGSNARGAVARLRRSEREDQLGQVLGEIASAAGAGPAPIVLSGTDGAVLSDNSYLAKFRGSRPSASELEAVARAPVRAGGFGVPTWNAVEKPLPLWLGRRFDVRGHALCVLKRSPQQNLLVLGHQVEVRNRMLACALASLAVLIDPAELEVLFVDGLRPEMPGGQMVASGLAHLAERGVAVRTLREEDLGEAFAELERRVDSPSPNAPSRLLVLTEPDYLYSLHSGADRFSAPTSGPTAALRKVLARGPQAGVHTIISVSGLTSLQLVLSPSREGHHFNHKVAQQSSEEDSMVLFSSLRLARLQEETGHPFSALHVDQVAGIRSAVLFHSYAADRRIGGDQSLRALQTQIAWLG